MSWVWIKIATKISFLGKELPVLDFAIGVSLVVVGLVWLIGLIIFLLKQKTKTKVITKQTSAVKTPPLTNNDLEVEINKRKEEETM